MSLNKSNQKTELAIPPTVVLHGTRTSRYKIQRTKSGRKYIMMERRRQWVDELQKKHARDAIWLSQEVLIKCFGEALGKAAYAGQSHGRKSHIARFPE